MRNSYENNARAQIHNAASVHAGGRVCMQIYAKVNAKKAELGRRRVQALAAAGVIRLPTGRDQAAAAPDRAAHATPPKTQVHQHPRPRVSACMPVCVYLGGLLRWARRANVRARV